MNIENRGKKASGGAMRATIGVIVLGLLTAASCAAQSAEIPKLNSCVTTNEGKANAYKLIALMTGQYYQAGDIGTAKKLADALEVTFDASVPCLKRRGVSDAEAEKIDVLMDAFIKPIQGATASASDSTAVMLAYHAYIAEIDTVKDSVQQSK